jgi:hypothetical protein
MIFDIYQPTLKIAGTSSRPFKNFTKENYDTFTRLKWRWLNSTITSKHHEEENKKEEESKNPAA